MELSRDRVIKIKYKILAIIVPGLLWCKPVLANIYLYELVIGSTGGSFLGGFIIFLLILYGAFFGSKLAKAIIWGWIMFFVTFGYCLSLFSNPELDFTGVAISFVMAGIVLAFFTYLAEREKKKEEVKLQKIRHNYFLKKSKKKKRKRKG